MAASYGLGRAMPLVGLVVLSTVGVDSLRLVDRHKASFDQIVGLGTRGHRHRDGVRLQPYRSRPVAGGNPDDSSSARVSAQDPLAPTARHPMAARDGCWHDYGDAGPALGTCQLP